MLLLTVYDTRFEFYLLAPTAASVCNQKKVLLAVSQQS